MSKETTITEKQFEGLRLVPPIDLHINYKHNLSTAIQAIYEFLRKTKDKKHKATYLNDELQTNVKVISAYKYLCDYFGIAFRCSAEGISELLKKLTNEKIQKTLKPKNVENIAKIVESYTELIELIIKAKEAKKNHNPTIEEIEKNPNLISTLNINTLTNEEGKNLVCRFFECFSHKETFQIMDNFNLEDTKKIGSNVWNTLSEKSPEGAMNFLKNKTKEIFINLSNNSNFINNCIEGGFVEGIREIMDTFSLQELKQIDANVWNTLSEKSPKEAMNFLDNRNKKGDQKEVFINLSRNSNFPRNCIYDGFGEGIRKIMDNVILEGIEKINPELFYYFSKESLKKAMKILNERGDKGKVFIDLCQNPAFIEHFIKAGLKIGLGEEIQEIMGTLSLEEIKQSSSYAWNTLSKESPEAVMKFLNNRGEDKKAVFISLFQETNFIGVFIFYGLGKEIRDIIFELKLQNHESFKIFMKELKAKNLVQKAGFLNMNWEKI